MEAARREAGDEATNARIAVANAGDKAVEEARAARNASVEAIMAKEAELQSEARLNAETVMEAVLAGALRRHEARLRAARAVDPVTSTYATPPGSQADRDLRLLSDLRNARSPSYGKYADRSVRWKTTPSTVADDEYSEIHREAWADFHAAAQQAQEERAQEDRSLEKIVAETRAAFDATATPAVLAFEAAARAEQAAREHIARVAPEAWAAYVAVEETRR